MPNANPSINVSVTFRHTDSTEALKKYAVEKVTQCVKKYVKWDSDVHVVLNIEKRDHIAEANMHSKGYDASVKSVCEDLYKAIDKMAEKLDAQLRRQKERTVQHKQPSAA